MKFVRRHWYSLGLISAAVAAGWLALGWQEISWTQRLLAMNFIALLLHQFEEYGWPGGEPAIMNIVLQKSDEPTRYPLNQNAAMVTNLVAAYGFYLLPVFLPNVIWFGLAPVLFGFGQFIVHGIYTPRKLGSFYNPGLAAVILLHFPIGGLYIYDVYSNNLITGLDWGIGVAYLVAFMFFGVAKATYSWMADRNSPYPFAEEEMRRFGVIDRISSR
jgi:Protein of unknown function with HXXEE motif